MKRLKVRNTATRFVSASAPRDVDNLSLDVQFGSEEAMHIIVHTTSTNDPARDRRVRQEVKTGGTRSYRFDKGQSVQRETKADGFAPPKVVPVVQEVPATIPDTFEPGSATAPMDTEQSGGVGQVAAATGVVILISLQKWF